MELRRVYLLSDCFGPGKECDDPDALVTTDIRSALPISVQREFDIWREPRIADHILRTILRLHSEIRGDIGITGVFVNSAPRVKKGVNGDPFHLATLRNGHIRLVAPIRALSPVRGSIATLHVLPDENRLFRPGEQFRSSFVPRLLDPNHRIPLNECDIAEIPPFPEQWTLSYYDRFWNLVTFDNRREPHELAEAIRLRIGQVVADMPIFSSLWPMLILELFLFSRMISMLRFCENGARAKRQMKF